MTARQVAEAALAQAQAAACMAEGTKDQSPLAICVDALTAIAEGRTATYVPPSVLGDAR